MNRHIEANNKVVAALELERRIVGVKFLRSSEDYKRSEVQSVKERMPYCVMIRLVSQGHSFKTDLGHSGCKGATRALGMEKPSDEFHTGDEYLSFGLYENLETAKKFADDMIFMDEEIYGLDARPLMDFDEEPDVVIIITNPYNAMRISQGYAYKYGHNNAYRISGNQAVCSECTATPFVKNDMNISMMCAGTRYLAGWDESELGIGFSIEKFIEVADGIFFSINGAETNEKKEKIIEKLKNIDVESPEIQKDGAYFIDSK